MLIEVKIFCQLLPINVFQNLSSQLKSQREEAFVSMLRLEREWHLSWLAFMLF